MLKKFPSDKINGTKNALFFLSRALTHHSVTFNLVRLSKTTCGFFHFRSVSFCSTKCMDSLTLKRHNFFQN